MTNSIRMNGNPNSFVDRIWCQNTWDWDSRSVPDHFHGRNLADHCCAPQVRVVTVEAEPNAGLP